MRVERTHGALVIRFGERFAAPEVDRASREILAASQLSQLALDFRDVKHLDLTAVIPLVEALEPLQGVSIAFRGLTLHQSRVFEYLGIRLSGRRRDPGRKGAAPAHGEAERLAAGTKLRP
jgi:hypothetical protein